jgi:hypothetical protein
MMLWHHHLSLLALQWQQWRQWRMSMTATGRAMMPRHQHLFLILPAQ